MSIVSSLKDWSRYGSVNILHVHWQSTWKYFCGTDFSGTSSEFIWYA